MQKAKSKLSYMINTNCIAGKLGIPSAIDPLNLHFEDKQPGIGQAQAEGFITCKALVPEGPLVVKKGGGCGKMTTLFSQIPGLCGAKILAYKEAVDQAELVCEKEGPKKETLDACTYDHAGEPGCDAAFSITIPSTCLPCQDKYQDWKNAVGACANATTNASIKMITAIKKCTQTAL